MIGILLNDFCTTYHVDLETLTEGLCTIHMYKKYKKITEKPEKLLADALWQRLGKSVEKFDVYLECDEFQAAMARIRIQLLIRHGKLKEAEDEIHRYEKTMFGSNPLHIQFLCLQYAEIYRRSHAPYEKQMKNLRRGLRQTIPARTLLPERMEGHFYSVLELLLLERYAFLSEEKFPENAIAWYSALEKYLTQPAPDGIPRDLADNSRLLPPLYYHYALRLIADGAYPQALEKLDAGLFMLRKCQCFEALFIRVMKLRISLRQKLNQTAGTGQNSAPSETAAELPLATENTAGLPLATETALLQVLKQEFEENGAETAENIYPDYPERNIFSVNNIFCERRLAHGYSKEDMAMIVDCDVRTLQTAENGTTMPQSRTKKKFFTEFGLTMRKYSGLLNSRTYSFYRGCADVSDYSYTGKHEKAREIYQKIAKGLDQDDLTNQRFIKYWDISLRRRKDKIERKKCDDELLAMLEETLPKHDAISGNCSLTMYERRILIDLAWQIKADDRLKIGDMLQAQYQKFHDNEALAGLFPTYYMGLARCLARFMRCQKKFEEAEAILKGALKQIHFLQDNFRLQSLCQGYFWLEIDRKKTPSSPLLPKKDEAYRWIQYAYAINKLYMQDTTMIKYIENQLDETFGDKTKILGNLL